MCILKDQLFDRQEFTDNQLAIEQSMVKYEPQYITGEVSPPVISSENYSGPFNFEVNIQGTSPGSKNQWIYSDKLNKIFVMMSIAFPVDFKWDIGAGRDAGKHLFVRATPLFSQPQHSQEMVVRCIQHSQPYDPSNQSKYDSFYFIFDEQF